MKSSLQFLTLLITSIFIISCSQTGSETNKRLDALESMMESASQSSNGDRISNALGGKVYSIDFPGEAVEDRPIVLFFINDVNENLYALGFKTEEYGMYFETVDGGCIDGPNGKDPILTPGDVNVQKGINCTALINRLGITNSAIVACLQAACNAANCRYHGSCGGQSQGYLDAVQGVFCMTANKDGVVCRNCNE